MSNKNILTPSRVAVLFTFYFIASAHILSSCGSRAEESPLGDTSTPSKDLGPLTAAEEIVFTDQYAGYLVLFLDGATPESRQAGRVVELNYAVQNGEDSLLKADADVDSVRGELVEPITTLPENIRLAFNAYPTAVVKRSIKTEPAKYDRWRAKIERQSKKNLYDFNRIMHIEATDPTEAVLLIRALKGMPGVERVYPKQKGVETTVSSAPLFEGLQRYLESNESFGGLNARAAWEDGIYGQDVMITDGEHEWNFEHYDLQLDFDEDNHVPVGCYPTPLPNEVFPLERSECRSSMAHGTAIVGILAARDDDHGVTGFAPMADVETGGASFDGYDDPEELEEYLELLPPGSIHLIEIQIMGSESSGSVGFSPESQLGYLPLEADQEEFAGIFNATNAGIMVIEGGGNGTVNLNDPDAYIYDPDDPEGSLQWPIGDRDSGAIIVGGSQGSNHRKISYSNYGPQVDAYAWAQGVVTTSYPPPDGVGADENPYVWRDVPGYTTPSRVNYNDYYTNQFGGTSSAAAMVAGAAALVQSYAKSEMGVTKYLTPHKIRDILTYTGAPQVGGTDIGKQPRINLAMAAFDTEWSRAGSAFPELARGERLNLEEADRLRSEYGIGLKCVELDPEASDPNCPEAEIYPPGIGMSKDMDIDGDDRADLVKWVNGEFQVDYSTRDGSGDLDNLGEWNSTYTYPEMPFVGISPVPDVMDMNADTHADLLVDDRENGIVYIKYMTEDLIGAGSAEIEWDCAVDFSSLWTDELILDEEMDPVSWPSRYQRFISEDYDGDGFPDITIARSDGNVMFAYGGPNCDAYVPGADKVIGTRTYGGVVRYLTDAELAAAPGWAYPIVRDKSEAIVTGGRMRATIMHKIPDGLVNEGKLIVNLVSGLTEAQRMGTVARDSCDFDDRYGSVHCGHIFGGNDVVVGATYSPGRKYHLKTGASYLLVESPYTSTTSVFPPNIWGGSGCHLANADFDGDDIDDLAVMCPDEWRIKDSSNAFTKSGATKDIPLGYDTEVFTLPGRSYSGGMSYQAVKDMTALLYDLDPTTPPPLLVDMTSLHLE